MKKHLQKGLTCLFYLVLLVSAKGFAQTTYTWNSSTAVWTTSTAWTPTRTTPATNDILVFSSNTTVTPTSVPTQTIGQLSVTGTTIVNLQAGGSNTLTIGAGLAGADLSVASGAQLNVNGANALNINIGTGNTASISGGMTFSTAVNTFTAVDASGITFNNGSTITQTTGNTGTLFGNSGTANTVIFASGSTFVQNAGSSPFGLTQPASKITFQTGSLYKITVNQAPAFTGRTYANFEWATAGSQTLTGGTGYTIDNLTVSSGTLNLNLTAASNIKGNISVASGQTLGFAPASATSLTFSGTTAQTITNAGTLTFGSNEAIIIANTATPTPSVTVNQGQTFAGAVTVNSGSTLIAAGSLTTSGGATINGTFQINQGGFASGGTWAYGAGATLVYNYTQVGSYGPVNAGHTYWPSTSGPTNVTLTSQSGSGPVDLGVARTVTGTFQTARGFTGAGNLTANGTLQINGGGFLTGTPTYGASSTLVYNTTSYTTSTNEFPATGVKNVTITAPSGNNAITFDADKTITGTLAVGTHSIGGGKSINAGTITLGTGSMTMGDITTSTAFTCSGASSISLSGSWNVTGFTRSTSTVNFTGAGNLASNSTFYNLTNSSGTRSITSSFGVENTLLVSGGDIQVSGGSGKTLTMSGTASTINITGGSITGTDSGSGNDLNLVVSGTQTTLTGNATSNNDHEKKFFTVTVNNGSTLALSRGILCRYGSFAVNGTLQINTNGYVQTNPSSSSLPSYNSSTGSLTYNNGGPYTIGGEWPGSNSPANVSLIASGTNVSLNANRTISGTLTLTEGTITTAANTLNVSNSAAAAVSRTNGYVIGNLQRAIGASGTYSYPVGVTAGYTPASFAVSASSGSGSLIVASLNGTGFYPSGLDATNRVNRHWLVTNSGVTGFTADATFTFLPADRVGAGALKAFKYDGSFAYPASQSSSSTTFNYNALGTPASSTEFGAGECGTVTVAAITGGGSVICGTGTEQLASTTPSGVWSSDNTAIATVSGTGLVTGVATGTTTIRYTVTEGSGCTGEATQSVSVEAPSAPTGSLTIVNSTCASACTVSGGSIALGSVAGSGGTLEFSTDNGGTWSATLPTYAAPQTILASIKTANCRSASITVGTTVAGVCTPVTPNITNNNGLALTCAIPNTTLTASGGVSYSWSNGDTTAATTVSTAGTFTVTVTGSNGCTATANVTTTLDNTPPTVTAANVSGCAGSPIALSGSPGGGSYSIANPYTGASTTYSYSYTNPANGCSATSSPATVTVQAAPNAGINGVLTICSGTTVTASQLFAQLTGSPQAGGTWSPTLAGAGVYTYTVAATSPCSTPATATVTVSAVSCQAAQLANCGSTPVLTSVNTRIFAANTVTQATKYRFRVAVSTAPSTYFYAETTYPSFRLTDVVGLTPTYGTTYNVDIQNEFLIGGNTVTSAYGQMCSVSTQAVTAVTVPTNQCGQTLAAVNSRIYVNGVTGATSYSYRIAKQSAPTTYAYIDTPYSNFRLTNPFTSGNVAIEHNTVYLVAVSVTTANGSSNYNGECLITTPAGPVTTLQGSQCGDDDAPYVIPTKSTKVYADNLVSGATYTFKLEQYSGATLVATKYATSPINYFDCNMFTGINSLLPSTNYHVYVAINFYGEGEFDHDCVIRTPAALKQEEMVTEFKAVAYPNPFADNFMIDVKSSSESSVNLKVYDMIGRLIDQKEVRVSDLETTAIGNNYPSGVYNVVVSQENSFQTVRVVKR